MGEDSATSCERVEAPAPPSRGAWQGIVRRLLALTRGRALIALTTVLFVAPALADLLSDFRRAPYRWLAADTFYYLTVSRNIARHGKVAFDGEHASNGFHPLWQLWGAGLELVRERLHLGPVGPHLLVWSGVVVIALAIWYLGLTLMAARRLNRAFLGISVGIYAVLAIPFWVVGLRAISAHGLRGWLMPIFGSLWSFANGMESAFVILCFALALYTAVARRAHASAGGALAFGGCLAGLTLARLDHGLLAATLFLGFGRLCLGAGAFRRWLLAGVTFGLPVALYLIVNWYFFGSFVPLSGATKSTFPHVTGENVALIRDLLRGSPSWVPSAGDSHWWLPVVCRQLQTLLPALLCLGYLVWSWRSRAPSGDPLRTLLAFAAAGAVLLGLYNFCFTRPVHQGFWYYPVSTLLPSLFVLAEPWPRLRLTPALRLAFASLLATLVTLFFVYWQRHKTYNEAFELVMGQASEAARKHYGTKLPKLLEIDDGVVGYSLDTPAMSHILALDPEGFRAARQGRLLELAVARGFDRVASSVAYRTWSSQPSDLANWVGGCLSEDVSGFSFEQEFSSADGQLLIVRVTKR
ncbi:MAG TPA: hypothetical protein VHP33_28985 [Polyangiaceae bacterium]|nr:hypothetical protein [Polyangiaceae bacterium]